MTACLCKSALLLACASASADGTGFTASWKAGTVTAVGDAASLGEPVESDCRSSRPASGEATERFAKVAYFSGRHRFVRIVPVPAGWVPAEGDSVELKMSGCDDALKAR